MMSASFFRVCDAVLQQMQIAVGRGTLAASGESG